MTTRRRAVPVRTAALPDVGRFSCVEATTKPAAVLPATLETAVPAALLRSEVGAWARRIGVRYREVHVRPMARKWASCSSRGRLTFDTDLLRQPGAFRAEVIVHELMHLKVPNHGKVFKALLRAHLRAIAVAPQAPTGRNDNDH